MARLPDSTALGENPVPVLPRRTPMISTYRPTSGFEEMPGQELAQSAGQVEQASHAALQAKIDQDNLRVEDLATQGKQAQYDLTYGKNGFIQLKGGDAVNRPLVKDYGDRFDSAVAQLAPKLDNDFQRQLFQKRMQAAGLQMREDIVRHVARETDVYASEAFKSGMDVDAKLAGARWGRPDADATSLLSMRNRIEGEARRQGLQGSVRDDWVEQHTMAARSSVYGQMIKQALASDHVKGPFAAEALLKLHGTELDATSRLVLTDEVKRAVLPLQYRAVAQDAIRMIIPKAMQAMQIGGQPALDQVEAAVARPTDYSYVTPAGDKVTGTAPTEAEARRRTRLGSGLPEYAAQKATTKIDTMALIGDAVATAESAWLKDHPGDTVGAQHVVAYVREQFGVIAQAEQAEQKKNYATITSALILDPQTGKKPATSMDQLLADPAIRAAYFTLDSLQQTGVQAHVQHNLVASLGHPMKADGDALEAAAKRVFLPSGDQNRINNVGDLLPLFNHGVNEAGFNFLSHLIDQRDSVNGQKFAVAARRAAESARSTLKSSLVGSVMPDAAGDAANQYYIDLQNKIDEYQSTPGKDPRTLLQHGTPDSMVDRQKVMSYLQITPKQAIAQDAAGRKAAAAQPIATLKAGNEEVEYDALPPGARYRGPDDPANTVRIKPGQPVAAPAAAILAAPAAPAYEAYVRAKPRSGGFYVEAPPRSPAKAIGGRTFETRADALAALRQLYEGGK